MSEVQFFLPPPNKGNKMSRIHIFGGGTFSHVRNHLAIAAPAFGETARQLQDLLGKHMGITSQVEVQMHLTKMADPYSTLVTNEDVEAEVDRIIANPYARVIFFNVALCDFNGQIGDIESGKYAERLQSRNGPFTMNLTVADKLIGKIREHRKDLFVIGFKTTAGASSDVQYATALNMLKANSINLVLANDTVTRNNMIVAPEETRYCESTDRKNVLNYLVKMVLSRSKNTYTRSNVVPGESVAWSSNEVPNNLRTVVDHCIARGAYKPFRGVTSGHFAVKISDTQIITSKRKHNFNRLAEEGMVRIDYEGDSKVIAHGFKPSVGGQSQRIVFTEHQDAECIVHFHSPLKATARDKIPIAEQAPNECGSHQCGANTSRNLKEFDGIKAVMLRDHGPNIIFNRSTDPNKVIEFIEANFDLADKTGGLLA